MVRRLTGRSDPFPRPGQEGPTPFLGATSQGPFWNCLPARWKTGAVHGSVLSSDRLPFWMVKVSCPERIAASSRPQASVSSLFPIAAATSLMRAASSDVLSKLRGQ